MSMDKQNLAERRIVNEETMQEYSLIILYKRRGDYICRGFFNLGTDKMSFYIKLKFILKKMLLTSRISVTKRALLRLFHVHPLQKQSRLMSLD